MSQVAKEGPLPDLEHQEPGVAKAVPHRTDLHSPVVLVLGCITFALREPGYGVFPSFPCKIGRGRCTEEEVNTAISLTCRELTLGTWNSWLTPSRDVLLVLVLSERELWH